MNPLPAVFCGSISGLLGTTKKWPVRKYRVIPTAVGRMCDPDARYYMIVRLAARKQNML